MNVFVGYDSREDIAYRVCKYSLLKHNPSVSVIPIVQKELRLSGSYYRETDFLSSTEFSLTRFLVPHLSNHTGWSLFCDCDFVWLEDVKNIFDLCQNKFAVMVVKHNYYPVNVTKMDGKVQHLYPRKNWSSMVLWNCEHPSNRKLTIETINNCNPSYLHQFKWLSDDEIGEVPVEWNWLVGWNSGSTPKAIHYTEGGPWILGNSNCDYGEVWNQYYTEYVYGL